jgi:aspartyl protease family protein
MEQRPEENVPSNAWVWIFLAFAWAFILWMYFSLGLHETVRELLHDKPQPIRAVPGEVAKAHKKGDAGQVKDELPAEEELTAAAAAEQDEQTDDAADTELASAEEPVVCDAAPPPSGEWIVEAERGTNIPVQFTSLNVDNQHYFPLLLRFINISAGGAMKLVYIERQTSDRLDIPAGNYRLQVEAGEDWCSPEKGFSDGEVLKYHDKMLLHESAQSVLRFVSVGMQPKDVMVSFTPGGVDRLNGAVKSMEVPKRRDGHFHLKAQINNHPVNFLVDTGATTTTIPYPAARAMGLDRQCKTTYFTTVAGRVQGCTAIADELRFGGFVLRQIEVAFNQGNDNLALLGMNVLSKFRIQQLDNTLLLSN